MPFKSKAQQRFMFAAESRGELPKGKALEWAHETKNIKKLPERKKTAADIANELIDRIDILAVDGGEARQKDQSFAVGGHHYVYPFIPENEIWIEKGNEGKDLSALIGHEVTERDEMKRQGLTYDQAHPIANSVEEDIRLSVGKEDGETQSADNTKTAAPKPYRDRSELFALDSKGRILGGFYPDKSFGTFGGGVSKGENKAKAAVREFKEESGYRVTNVRPAGLKPFITDWSELGEKEDLSSKQLSRMRNFKGSRTHFFVGDVDGSKGDRSKVDAKYPFKEVKFRPLEEVIKKQESVIKKDDDLATGTAARRLEVLRILEKQKMPKTAADNEKKTVSNRSTLVKFFNKNPNPDDESFHDFAESKGINKHKLEAEAYELATGHARFLGDGRAKEKSVTESDVDSGELSKGTEVETEHTPDRTTSKRVALDHLAEIPDYYTRLKKMEDSATSSEKKTASDIMASVAQRIYESEKSADEVSGLTRLFRLSADVAEEGADQYMRYKFRQKRKDEYAKQQQHQSLPKVAAGANFPPISGPTATSGITTSSQQEEKMPRCPPIPKPEAQALALWDVAKVSSLIESLVPKVAGLNPKNVEDPQEVYDKAVSTDRRHKILTNMLSSGVSSGITTPIMLKQMGLTGGNLAKASLGITGISAALGAAAGGVSGMVSSRRSMKNLYDAEGMKGLHEHVKRRGLAESALAGTTGGLIGAGTSMLIRGRTPTPFQGSDNASLKTLGKFIPAGVETATGLGTSMAGTYMVDKVVDAMHNKEGSHYYDSYPHSPEAIPVPADNYSARRQGLLYAASALHPFMAAPAAAMTANPGDRIDQFGRTLLGSIGGDVVGGLAGSFALGPSGFLMGSLLGRPAGTYIAHHLP